MVEMMPELYLSPFTRSRPNTKAKLSQDEFGQPARRRIKGLQTPAQQLYPIVSMPSFFFFVLLNWRLPSRFESHLCLASSASGRRSRSPGLSTTCVCFDGHMPDTTRLGYEMYHRPVS